MLIVGAGDVSGEGATRALLELGAIPVAACRSEARPHGLANHVADAAPGTPHLRVVDVSDLDGGAVRARLAENQGQLDGVVLTIANRGPPMEVSDDVWAP
ncbi:hypothetical protein [Streptomyces sp. LN245]|uniref:hypothetical protein n=1 Tax=Streptomyces sp. LN245 TaxID=3112975 RepID=UPI003720BF62